MNWFILDLKIHNMIFDFFNRIWLIIISILSGGILALIGSMSLIQPVYASSMKISVYNTAKLTEKITYTDIYASQMLVPSYAAVMKSKTILNSLALVIADGTTGADLNDYIRIETSKDTNIINIIVVTTSAKKSYKIAGEFAALIPDAVPKLIKAGSLVILDEPDLQTEPYSRNRALVFFTGALSGLFIAFMMILIFNKFDARVKGAEDIKSKYAIPILGEIPDFDMVYRD